jgi:hypothetical protein
MIKIARYLFVWSVCLLSQIYAIKRGRRLPAYIQDGSYSWGIGICI